MERRGSREEQVVVEGISPGDMVLRGPSGEAVRPSEDLQDLEEQNFSSEGGIFEGFDAKLVLEIALYWMIMFCFHLLMAVGAVGIYLVLFGGLQQIVTIVGWTMVNEKNMTSSVRGRFVLASTSLSLLVSLFIFGLKLHTWLPNTTTFALATRREKVSYFLLLLFHILPAFVSILMWSMDTGLVVGMLLQTLGTISTSVFWYLQIKDYEYLTLKLK